MFNVADLDGLPAVAAPAGGFEPDTSAEYLLQASGAEIVEGGTRAFYHPATDTVHLPDRARFDHAANFYHVALHELTHNAARRIMPRRSRISRIWRLFRRGWSA